MRKQRTMIFGCAFVSTLFGGNFVGELDSLQPYGIGMKVGPFKDSWLRCNATRISAVAYRRGNRNGRRNIKPPLFEEITNAKLTTVRSGFSRFKTTEMSPVMNRQYESVQLIPEKDLKIQCPTVMLVQGVTSSGKSTLVSHMLMNHERYFTHQFASIYFLFSYPQPLYALLEEKLGSDRIIFSQGYPGDTALRDTLETLPRPCLLIADDLDTAVFSSPFMLEVAKGGSHHTNLSLIVLAQQIYYSPSSAKFAREFIKQARAFLLTALVKEKFALRTFAVQLNVPPRYLISAYEQAVERRPIEDNTLAPGHLFLNFAPNVKEQLRAVGNFVRPAAATVQSKDIRTRVWWLFASAMFAANSTKKQSNDSEGAKLFYLLSAPQLASIQQQAAPRKNVTRTSFPKDIEVGKATAYSGSDTRKAWWRELLTITIPTVTRIYPSEIRRKAIELGEYMHDRGADIGEDGELSFPDPDDNDSTITERNAADTLLYFVTPVHASTAAGRPHSLYSLAKFLMHAPDHLFHSEKRPRKLLESLRMFYRQS